VTVFVAFLVLVFGYLALSLFGVIRLLFYLREERKEAQLRSIIIIKIVGVIRSVGRRNSAVVDEAITISSSIFDGSHQH
jgi:hypothetical protein